MIFNLRLLYPTKKKQVRILFEGTYRIKPGLQNLKIEF